MVNHEHKFLFIHIPRTGGTSIEFQFHNRGARGRVKHWNLNDWKKQLNDKNFESYFKFTFVRNPWDIIASKYVSSWYGCSKQSKQIGLLAGKTMKYFLENYQLPPSEHGDALLDYFDPEQMDFVGRFESRDQDLEHICKKIGVNLDVNIQKKSHQDKKHYTEYYDEDTRSIVAEKYAKDIEYFNYEFGE